MEDTIDHEYKQEKPIGHREYKESCFTSQCYTPKKKQQQLMKKMKKKSTCNLI